MYPSPIALTHEEVLHMRHASTGVSAKPPQTLAASHLLLPFSLSVLCPTKGPMWGYPRGRFWDLGTVLEPFCGKLLPKVDKPVQN